MTQLALLARHAVTPGKMRKGVGSRHSVKDVYERYLQSLKSRKFESSSEGTQPKRPRCVYCIKLRYIMAWANSSCLS